MFHFFPIFLSQEILEDYLDSFKEEDWNTQLILLTGYYNFKKIQKKLKKNVKMSKFWWNSHIFFKKKSNFDDFLFFNFSKNHIYIYIYFTIPRIHQDFPKWSRFFPNRSKIHEFFYNFDRKYDTTKFEPLNLKKWYQKTVTSKP